MLRFRTGRGMVELSDLEAAELLRRLNVVSAARPAIETITVSANASTSVTLTTVENVAVFGVLELWFQESGREGIGRSLANLRDALADSVEQR